MSDEQLVLTLAKVLIAAAWVDGELTREEVNSMKDLLYALPELTGLQWARLDMYIETPVGDAERERLVEELRQEIQTPDDRELALKALKEMMVADGQITEDERLALSEMEAAIESVDLGLFSRIVKGMTGRRS